MVRHSGWTIAVALFAVAVSVSAESLRIGLIGKFKDTTSVTVSCSKESQIKDASGAATVIPKEESITLLANGTGLKLIFRGQTTEFKGSLVIESKERDSVFALSSPTCAEAKYRGQIAVSPSKSGMLLVNEIDLEDYVRGVLPSEMPSSFNLEALKAQAVAARTFAWVNRGKHSAHGYDLCDLSDCQVYLGAGCEKPSTSKATEETTGLVMSHGGKVIWAQYSADCGGTTQDGGKPYLCSVVDRPNGSDRDFCEHNGHIWTISWPVAEFERLLAKLNPDIKRLKSLAVVETDSAGRVKTLKVDTDKSSFTFTGTQIRRHLGLSTVKSTAFTVRIENGQVVFDGKGFGHGIGLCQWGANGMASPPHNCAFEQILKHYYQGVQIVHVSSIR